MSFILYYDPTVPGDVQYFVPPGTPIDELASTLGIIALNLNKFPGVAFSSKSPTPPDWNYDSVNPNPSIVAMVQDRDSFDETAPARLPVTSQEA